MRMGRVGVHDDEGRRSGDDEKNDVSHHELVRVFWLGRILVRGQDTGQTVDLKQKKAALTPIVVTTREKRKPNMS